MRSMKLYLIFISVIVLRCLNVLKGKVAAWMDLNSGISIALEGL